jgi:pimeloyl-ACP methyl ester carboxylesterase
MAERTVETNVQRKAPNDRQAADRTAGLHARDVGDGKPVVLLHALPFNSRMWEPQLEALARQARLIAPDFPGFGLSPMREVHSLSDYAQAVVELLDALGVDEVMVAGISSGAYVAFEMIAPLGNRLKGLVIAAAVAAPGVDQTPLDRHRLAAEVECGSLDAAASEYIPKLLGWDTRRCHPDLISRLRGIACENNAAGVAAMLRAIADRPDFSSILPEIRCPVLCIAGAEDVLTPPEMIRDMAERIPVARPVNVPGAGHLVNLEAPETFNRELGKFIDETTTISTVPGVDYNANTRAESDADVRRR